MNSKHGLASLVVLEFIALFVFYSGFISGASNFFFADATFWLEPMARFLADSFAAHKFPLWNPLTYGGMPQTAVTFPNLFYPFDYLFVVLPFSCALALSMVLHQTLAAFSTYILLRSLKQPQSSALVGALLYSLSGYMFGLVSNHSLVAGAAWCPLLIFTLRAVETESAKRRFWLCLTGCISLFMLLTAGRPEVFVPGIVLALSYMALSAYIRKSRGGDWFSEGLTWQIRVVFLGFILALPSILPTAEWLSRSRRVSGLHTFEVFLNSASWYELLTMVIGPALGDLRLQASEFRSLIIPINIPPYLSCCYVGSVAFTLALWGACTRQWWPKWWLLGLIALIGIVSLGDNTFVMPFLVQVAPALGFVRFPVKLLFVLVFAVAILAGRGMSACLDGEKVETVSLLFWSLACALFLGLIVSSNSGSSLLPFAGFGNTKGAAIDAQRLIGLWGLVSSVIGLLVTGIAYLRRSNKLSRSATASILVSLLVATLATNALLFERASGSGDYYQIPSFAVDRIRDFQKNGINSGSRVLQLCIELFTVPAFYLRGTQEERTAATFQYDRQLLVPNTNMDFAIPATTGFEGSMRGDYHHEFLHCYFRSSQSLNPTSNPPSDLSIARFAQVMSTGFSITQVYRHKKTGETINVPKLDTRYFELLLEDANMNVRIYRVLNTMPRTYLTHNWRNIEDHNQALNAILKPEESSFDPNILTLIENASHQNAQANAVCLAESDKLELSEPDAEHILVKTNSNEPGYLVLADQDYPGWQATVDNNAAPILVANGFCRAVYVPKGEHSILFSYVPWSMYLGLALSALAVVLLLYLAWANGVWRQAARTV